MTVKGTDFGTRDVTFYNLLFQRRNSSLSSMKRFYSVLFTLFSIFSFQIIIWGFKIYELKNVGSVAKYVRFLLCHSTELCHFFFGLPSFFSLSTFSIKSSSRYFALYYLLVVLPVGGTSVNVVDFIHS